MDEQEYEEIIQCLIDKDGMVVDEEVKKCKLYLSGIITGDESPC